MKSVIVDSCIWFALVDKKDAYSQYAEVIANMLQPHKILVPYPSLYETINTKLVKNERGQADRLFDYLNNAEKVTLIPDDKYRQEALRAVQSNLEKGKTYSLVDMIIRLMMEDVNLGPIAVMTFNVKDFVGVNHTEIVNPLECGCVGR